ncbi:hypothetical protein HNQ07_003767 [Deinococcus metalli]|uniref:Nucleotidyltransferase domain-containing protein n=1 Tax=Deinococcus metalli TaxID=1141878 RepID=A0A7W8KHH1_9DEIO|nr:hypothetical protein [Deinococcus metalli]MBB5378266.1 hypothetical protein [Deinococcus metalli]GHF57291.1 hypothetical protein GCM10017781_37050 [Deinococcus metalli]
MDTGEHAAFTAALGAALAARTEVLGLILLGSTAGTHHAPDAHSDHDFFVIVTPDAADSYRASPEWLPPRAASVVHHHRDTTHGARVIYADGHLLEYAVFTPDELAVSRNHHARVAFDRVGDLPRRLAATLPDREPPPAPDVAGVLSDLMLHLLVGVGRHARGERLAAHQMVRVYAVQDHLTLLRTLEPPAAPDLLDVHNVWRRVERTHPAHAEALEAALALPLPAGAAWLLNLAEAWWSSHGAWSPDVARAVRARIEAAGRP